MEINASIDQPNYDSTITNKHTGENWDNVVRDAFDRAIGGELDSDGVMDYVINEQLKILSDVHE